MRSLCSSQWRGIPLGSADEIFRRAAGSGRGSAERGGGRGRQPGPCRRAAARGGAEPCGAERSRAVRRPQPQPQPRRALGEPRSLETSPGGAGRQGHGSTAERRGRGGVGAGPQAGWWVCWPWESLLGRRMETSQRDLQVFVRV